jgi:hypothetical protein
MLLPSLLLTALPVYHVLTHLDRRQTATPTVAGLFLDAIWDE